MGHREALLEGARRCLEEKGYARTTARDIVAASGTNLASIGYHFGSKERLLNEAIGHAFEEWTERVAEVAFAQPGASPLEQMQASWTAMTDSFEEHRAIMVAFTEALAQAERSPELRAELAALYQSCRERIAAMIRRSLGDDVELAGSAPEAIASFSMAVCDGLAIQYLLDPERTPSGDELVAALGGALAYSLRERPTA